MWDDQFEFFSHNHQCVRVDLRGFGKSDRPDKPYSHHEDLHALLKYLDIDEPAVLVGLSMGGLVAANYVLAYPEQVRGLILVDAIVGGYEFKGFDELDEMYRLGETRGVDEANQRWLNCGLFKPAQQNRQVAHRLHQMVSAYSGWHWKNDDPVTDLQPPALQRLSEIQAPALIIVGEKDLPDFLRLADLLTHGIRNSRKRAINGVGHMSNMEKPSEFNRYVSEFLNAT
jgi:pimeloyl-ACP methyl ester carboxylesterase